MQGRVLVLTRRLTARTFERHGAPATIPRSGLEIVQLQVDPFVVIVDRHREGPLGGILTNHIPVQIIEYAAGHRQGLPVLGGILGLVLLDDLRAELDALVADGRRGALDQTTHLMLVLTAELTSAQAVVIADHSSHSQPSRRIGKDPQKSHRHIS